MGGHGRHRRRGRPVDSVTLTAALRAMKREHAVGGVAYFREVARSVAQDDVHRSARRTGALAAQRRIAPPAADAHPRGSLAGEDVGASVARMERVARNRRAEGPHGARRDGRRVGRVRRRDRALRRATASPRSTGRSSFIRSSADSSAGQLTVSAASPAAARPRWRSRPRSRPRRPGRVLFGAMEMPRTDVAWRIAAGYCRWSPPSVDRIRSRKLGRRDHGPATRVARGGGPAAGDRRPPHDGGCILRARPRRALARSALPRGGGLPAPSSATRSMRSRARIR